MSSSVYDDGATSVLLCGVGGQGTILAADVLAKTALASGDEVKLSEIHGMAQRGGAVTTDVRFGSHVNSMVCCEGSADVILAFETTEALRNIPYLRSGGDLLVNQLAIRPLPVLTGQSLMPEDAEAQLSSLGATLIPAQQIAQSAGSSKTANVVLLGALSMSLSYDQRTWEDVLRQTVPDGTQDMNIDAFRAGRAAVQRAE